MDFVQIAISARLAHGDLVAADQALESDPSVLGVRLILVKQILLSCANVADLELISRGLYREHPEIGELITPYGRNFEFAKYIRNIAVGHVNPALSRKAIEWRPELNSVLATPKPGGDAFLGFAILETAINTFVDGDSHRIFEGDTDLGDPPDLTRFLSFFGKTAHVGMAYCEALGQVCRGQQVKNGLVTTSAFTLNVGTIVDAVAPGPGGLSLTPQSHSSGRSRGRGQFEMVVLGGGEYVRTARKRRVLTAPTYDDFKNVHRLLGAENEGRRPEGIPTSPSW